MMKFLRIFCCSAILLLSQQALRAVEISDADFDQMKKDRADLEQLKKDVADLRKKPQISIADDGTVEKCLDNKYGPDAPATTRLGKLTIGGLMQIWYYGFQHDNHGLFNNPAAGISDNNRGQDINTFRVRREELNLTMDITDKITSYTMIDFARETTSFPFLEDNQGNAFIPKAGLNGVGGVQSGGGFVPAILQDALINFHDYVPHHDFTVGQYLPYFSQEDFLPNFVLDFCERSFVGNHFARELGATVHGSWIDNGGGGFYCGGGDNGRVQYWASVFDGASNYHSPEGTFQSQNRSDDNQDKDFLGTILVRPLWKDCKWGSLEFGYAGGFGKHGGSSVIDPINGPVGDLNRRTTAATRSSAWMSYFPEGPVKGLWVKGEYAYVRDRNFPGFVPTDLTDPVNNPQSPNRPFTTQGFYAAVGYKVGDGCSVPDWAKPFEIACRYQEYQNIEVANPSNPDKTDLYKTREFTPGINYYIRGQNMKIQANYNFMWNPDGPAGQPFHNVKNDSFALNFQVMF